jgi:midasin
MSKFEKLLDLLVNEQKDEAEKVFHEIVVEKSRQIYEGILAEEETSEADESSDKVEGDEVEEAKHDKKDKKDEAEEVEETEEPAESTDETIEEIGGDATDDLISDIEAEADGMDDMEMPGEEGDDEGEDGEEGEAEEMFEPLEKELDALKAEFAKMMDEKDEEPEEESFEPELDAVESAEELEVEESTSKDADTLIKEYSEMVSDGHGAEKMGSEKNADHKASPVAKSNKPVNTAGAHKMDQGGEGKGGVGKALTGDTAKDMGVTAKNEPGIKSAKMDNAPKAQEKEGSVDGKSPVASK